MTRRQLAGALMLPAAAAPPAAPAQAGQGEDLDALARRNLERNREALSKFDLPMATEPAFRFEA
ncbi:MAG: hypothetical protein R2729_29685 [Bryobacteraceae bacterium]